VPIDPVYVNDFKVGSSSMIGFCGVVPISQLITAIIKIAESKGKLECFFIMNFPSVDIINVILNISL
jgi:hypothetical protein